MRDMRGKRLRRARSRASEERKVRDMMGRRLLKRIVCRRPGWSAGGKKPRIQLAIANDAWGRLKRFAFSSCLSRPHASFAIDRKSTRLNSSHGYISYAVFCLKKKNTYGTNLATE